MKSVMLAVAILLAFTFVLSASAETFVLKDGKEIEGTVLRTSGSKVTLKTESGISTYDIVQFDEKTRGEYFGAVEAPELSRPKSASALPTVSLGEAKPKVVVGLMIAGMILCVVGSLWFIVAGFAESVGWGVVLILFNGVAGLAFLILHWDRAKAPVLTYLLGVGLLIAGALIGGEWTAPLK